MTKETPETIFFVSEIIKGLKKGFASGIANYQKKTIYWNLKIEKLEIEKRKETL